MIGYRFENVCKAMGLKYRSPDKFPRNKKEVWKRHRKLEKTKLEKTTDA